VVIPYCESSFNAACDYRGIEDSASDTERIKMTKRTPATFQAGKVIAMHQAKKDVAGGLMFFVGLGLCFTIVGAIVGIPLIIASFKASKADRV
jgi:hypothetical protein